VGLAQIERLEELLEGRRRQHEGYRELLAGGSLRLLEGHEGDACSWWLSVAAGLEPGQPARLVTELAAAGIQSRRVFIPFDTNPLYALYSRKECTVARHAYESCLALPSSAHLDAAGRARVAGELLSRARRSRSHALAAAVEVAG
jgi:dTDP-4-amino-4,6-dideoxygalactose transaminase